MKFSFAKIAYNSLKYHIIAIKYVKTLWFDYKINLFYRKIHPAFVALCQEFATFVVVKIIWR